MYVSCLEELLSGRGKYIITVKQTSQEYNAPGGANEDSGKDGVLRDWSPETSLWSATRQIPDLSFVPSFMGDPSQVIKKEDIEIGAPS